MKKFEPKIKCLELVQASKKLGLIEPSFSKHVAHEPNFEPRLDPPLFLSEYIVLDLVAWHFSALLSFNHKYNIIFSLKVHFAEMMRSLTYFSFFY